MGTFSIWHWVIVLLFGVIPTWLVVRALWRLGNKPEPQQPVVIIKEIEVEKKKEGQE